MLLGNCRNGCGVVVDDVDLGLCDRLFGLGPFSVIGVIVDEDELGNKVSCLVGGGVFAEALGGVLPGVVLYRVLLSPL